LGITSEFKKLSKLIDSWTLGSKFVGSNFRIWDVF